MCPLVLTVNSAEAPPPPCEIAWVKHYEGFTDTLSVVNDEREYLCSFMRDMVRMTCMIRGAPPPVPEDYCGIDPLILAIFEFDLSCTDKDRKGSFLRVRHLPTDPVVIEAIAREVELVLSTHHNAPRRAFAKGNVQFKAMMTLQCHVL